MNTETTTRRPSRLERRTGLAYLGIIVTGIFAEFAVRGSLIVDDDPIQTAANIADSPGLFGVGIAADVAMIAFDVTVAIGLFRLLRHVDRRLAVATTALRLVQGAVIALNLNFLIRALAFAHDARGAAGTIDVALAQHALDAVERHALGYDIGLIAFALSCFVLARLLTVGRLVPRLLAAGMVATGAVYLVGSLAAVFAPGASAAVEPFYGIALITELAFAILLVTRGLATPSHTTEPQPAATAA